MNPKRLSTAHSNENSEILPPVFAVSRDPRAKILPEREIQVDTGREIESVALFRPRGLVSNVAAANPSGTRVGAPR